MNSVPPQPSSVARSVTDARPSAHVVVVSFGSLGDFLPPLGLARELAALGVRVDMVGPNYFAPYAQAAGLPFVGYGHAEAYARDLADPRGIDPGLAWVAEFCGGAGLTAHIAAVEAAVAESGARVAVIAPLHAVGALFAAKRHGLKSIGLLTAPNLMANYRNPRPIAETAYRAAFRGAGMDDPPPPVTDPSRTFLGDYVLSFDHILELFPAWFDAFAYERPANSLGGTFPGETATQTLQALQDFATAAARPWVFFPGSGGGVLKVRPDLFELAAQVCRQSGRRAIMLDPRAKGPIEVMGEGVVRGGMTNLNALLPLASGFFHHGGVGCTSQAMKAGVAQVVAPVGYDQPGNAAWVNTQGLGTTVDPRALSAENLREALDAAERLPEAPRQAIADRLQKEGGARGLAAQVAALLPGTPTHAATEGR